MEGEFGPSSETRIDASDRGGSLGLVASTSLVVRAHFSHETAPARVRMRTLTLSAVRADVEPMLPAVNPETPTEVAIDSDEALIIGASEGNSDALAKLYDRYAPSLLSLGQRILGGRRDAEDLLHDVFVEVWQQAGDYSPARGSVKSWIFLRMRSRAIDRLRLASRKNVELGEQVLATATREVVEDPALSPDRALVRETLSSLPPDQRIAIELAYFGGLSGAQIAAQLGVPLGTVKTRLALAMSKLRAAFGEEKGVGK